MSGSDLDLYDDFDDDFDDSFDDDDDDDDDEEDDDIEDEYKPYGSDQKTLGEKLGLAFENVGGLDDQLDAIVRRVLASRYVTLDFRLC